MLLGIIIIMFARLPLQNERIPYSYGIPFFFFYVRNLFIFLVFKLWMYQTRFWNFLLWLISKVLQAQRIILYLSIGAKIVLLSACIMPAFERYLTNSMKEEFELICFCSIFLFFFYLCLNYIYIERFYFFYKYLFFFFQILTIFLLFSFFFFISNKIFIKFKMLFFFKYF